MYDWFMRTLVEAPLAWAMGSGSKADPLSNAGPRPSPKLCSDSGADNHGR